MLIPAGNLYHPRHYTYTYLFQHHTSEGNAYLPQGTDWQEKHVKISQFFDLVFPSASFCYRKWNSGIQAVCRKYYTTYVVKRLIFVVHVAVSSVNALLSTAICRGDKAHCQVYSSRVVHCMAHLWSKIIEYTHDEYCDMLLNLGSYVIRLGNLLNARSRARAGRSGDRIPVGARFSAPVQTGSGAHPASYTMGTGSFPWVKRPGRGVDYPPHLYQRLKKE
jgi:hypothetical protein